MIKTKMFDLELSAQQKADLEETVRHRLEKLQELRAVSEGKMVQQQDEHKFNIIDDLRDKIDSDGNFSPRYSHRRKNS